MWLFPIIAAEEEWLVFAAFFATLLIAVLIAVGGAGAARLHAKCLM